MLSGCWRGEEIGFHLACSPTPAPGRWLCCRWRRWGAVSPTWRRPPPKRSSRLAGSNPAPRRRPLPASSPPSHAHKDDARAPCWLPAWHAALPRVGAFKWLLSLAYLWRPDLGRPLQYHPHARTGFKIQTPLFQFASPRPCPE